MNGNGNGNGNSKAISWRVVAVSCATIILAIAMGWLGNLNSHVALSEARMTGIEVTQRDILRRLERLEAFAHEGDRFTRTQGQELQQRINRIEDWAEHHSKKRGHDGRD